MDMNNIVNQKHLHKNVDMFIKFQEISKIK